jgi:hypothetical protein
MSKFALIGNPSPVRGTVQRRCSECNAIVYVQPENTRKVDQGKGSYVCLRCVRKGRIPIAGLMHHGTCFDRSTSTEKLSKLIDDILKEAAK